MGAGLGGGSSNAASTLLALNSLAGDILSNNELLAMAASLGSDVPFFINGGAAWVTGRGEIIETLPPPFAYRVLLFMPEFRSNTTEAFKFLDQYLEKNPDYLLTERKETDLLKKSLYLPPKDWPYTYDFLPALPEKKKYRIILKSLLDYGAEFAGLSGSGSCCFGIFHTDQAVYAAKKALSAGKKPIIKQNFIQNTFFLASKAIPVLK